MNDQIQELLLKVHSQTKGGIYNGHPSEWTEKFAKLIVLECANILMKPEYPMTHPEELSEYNKGWVNGRLLGIEHIKEHFGVKE